MKSAVPLGQWSRRRWRSWLAVAVLSCLVAFIAITAVRIERQADRDETRQADVIVIFGAAEYAGRPSPVFRARLEHGYDLFQRGLAPVIIITGGPGGESNLSEGGVGRDYLLRRGIPESRIIAETTSVNTEKSAERVAGIMRANGMQTCIAVSDGYHIFRIKKLLESYGVNAYGAPRPQPPAAGRRLHRALLILREASSYLLWKLGIL